MINSLSEFKEAFRISDADFEKANISWDELCAIRTDYNNRRTSLEGTANAISQRLQAVNGVHSVRVRVKAPDHLLEKIVRKCRANPRRNIRVDNYMNEITDLIGARALHLFKADWCLIHAEVMQTWKQKEKPTPYIRKGDDVELFKAKDLKTKEHPAGYRSVHYILKTNVAIETHFVELQVRTLMEEAWGEIDHQVRYPYFTDDSLLQLYCRLLNGMTGNADAMATLILEQQAAQQIMKAQQADYQATLLEQQAKIDELAEKYQMVSADKQQLLNQLASLDPQNESKHNQGPISPHNPDLQKRLVQYIVRSPSLFRTLSASEQQQAVQIVEKWFTEDWAKPSTKQTTLNLSSRKSKSSGKSKPTDEKEE